MFACPMFHVCMTSWLWMGHSWNSGSCGRIGCSLHLVHSSLNSLPTIHNSWCISAVMLFHLGFHPLTLRACWLVLVCCNLQSPQNFPLPVCLIRSNLVSLSSEVLLPFFHILFCRKVACLSLAVWVARLTRSLTLSFSTFCYHMLWHLQYMR